MATLNIDNREFDVEALNENAQKQVQNIAIVDAEIQRLQVQLAIAQTAREAFITALRAALPLV